MGKVSVMHEVAVGIVLLVLVAFLSAACGRLLGPKASSTVVPSPSLTRTSSQAPETHVCYVFIASYGVQLGGMPALVEKTYISNDGTAQQVQERTDDVVLSLQEGEADVTQILLIAADLTVPAPAVRGTESPTGVVILPEYAGPSLFLEVAFSDATLKTWIGNPDDMPDAVKALVDAARELGRAMPTHVLQTGQRYIRSQPLSSDTATLLRRAGIVIDISPEQLARAPLVEKAIRSSCRLIEVPSDEGLYGTIPFSFVQGRSAHVAYGNQVFQIRHLVATEP